MLPFEALLLRLYDRLYIFRSRTKQLFILYQSDCGIQHQQDGKYKYNCKNPGNQHGVSPQIITVFLQSK